MSKNSPPNPAPANTQPLLTPQPATLLLDSEIARRETLAARGRIQTGCHELDEHVLLGGFDRGSVVGVSAEEEEGGLGLGLAVCCFFISPSFSAFRFVLLFLGWAGLFWVGLVRARFGLATARVVMWVWFGSRCSCADDDV